MKVLGYMIGVLRYMVESVGLHGEVLGYMVEIVGLYCAECWVI